MEEPQLPFALHVASGRLVEVDEVPTGLQCGCICPGCQTPVVGKRYIDRINHFAHKTRKTFQETKTECNYSFLVSVRAMCKQILTETTMEFRLPEYRIDSEPETFLSSRISPLTRIQEKLHIPAQYVTTPSRSVSLSPKDIQVECDFNGTLVDGLSSEHKIVIYFTYDGRPIPSSFASAVDNDIVVIDLTFMEPAIRTKDKEKTIRARLTDFIYQGLEYKNLVVAQNSSSLQSQLQQIIAQRKDETEQAWFAEHTEFARKREEQRREQKAIKAREEQYWEELRQRERERRQFAEANRRNHQQTESAGSLSQADNQVAKMSIPNVIDFIKTNGNKPQSVAAIVEEHAVIISDGWLVAEKDKIWFISPVDTSNWRDANVRYSAGMRAGIWVERTEELELALNIQKPSFDEDAW